MTPITYHFKVDQPNKIKDSISLLGKIYCVLQSDIPAHTLCVTTLTPASFYGANSLQRKINVYLFLPNVSKISYFYWSVGFIFQYN